LIAFRVYLQHCLAGKSVVGAVVAEYEVLVVAGLIVIAVIDITENILPLAKLFF
jgi:hypothetical protein